MLHLLNIEDLISHFQRTWFSDFAMGIIEIFLIIIAFLNIRKEFIGKLFIIYLAIDWLILISNWSMLIDQAPAAFRSKFVTVSNTFIAFLELGLYFFYFSKILVGRKVKPILYSLFAFYWLLMICYSLTGFSFLTARLTYVSLLMDVIEFLLLIYPCFLYFNQLFKISSGFKLNQRPSFWIVTGIFSFSLISIPYYLLTDLIKSYTHTSSTWFSLTTFFYYVPLITNFLFLSKAFTCKNLITT